MFKKSNVIIYTDGACKGNPSNKCGIGGVLYKNNVIIGEFSKGLMYENVTNNMAEYLAFIEGCKLCNKHNIKDIEIQGDSLLILNQLGNIYKVKSENLIPLNNEGKMLLSNFNNYKLIHIKREFNTFADTLANKGVNEIEQIEVGF